MRSLVPALLTLLLALPAVAETGPRLAAVSNSGQGWLPDLAGAAIADGLLDFRDAVYWSNVERDGVFVFDQPTTTYPDALARAGAGLSLTVNNGHPDHDDGDTPHTEAAIAAFAANAAATVARFPNIHSVEVGNEVNAQNFVSGPVREAGIAERARYHLALLAATYAAVKAVRPEVRVLGGGTHSIPGRYLADLLALDAREHMDALAIHPYTTPVEHLVKEIAFLRRLPGAEGIALEVTEFGLDGPDAAGADFLLKSYCMYALAGVDRVAWYPLNPRGDGFAALYSRQGARLPTGEAHLRIRSLLEGRAVRDVSPDPFTYACAFGPDAGVEHLVLWGEPRSLEAPPGLRITDARGAVPAVPAVGARPLIISARPGGTVRIGETLRLGPQPVLADSYHQYDLPREEGQRAPGDPFERFARRGEEVIALPTRPGQDRGGVPWSPYRGAANDPALRLDSRMLIPAGNGADPIEIVHRLAPPDGLVGRLRVALAVPERSEDGVTLRIMSGKRVLAEALVTQAQVLELPLVLEAGVAVDIAIGPNGSATGDVVDYRFTVLRP